jgi:hypothetical protein
MATETMVRVPSDTYYIRESGGYFYVSKPSWGFGRHQLGWTRSKSDALDLIRSDSGEEIKSIS